ncbi:sulfurtransferase [uncultured Thiohalocapsa sp.]|uniref:sulfurtransferase n=1 Tax=uncultured Thiohalocapsa sp. TaxID=768990 RepID=UPI0025E3A454|nr:rhodanese-like domain-containing protein [uncultured Thiohalocapsa sp.]
MLRHWLLTAALSAAVPIFTAPMASAANADGAPPLVDAAWLGAHADDVVVVDLQEPEAFQRFHVPGAVNLPYERWRTRAPKDRKDPALLASMLPDAAVLETMLGEAGIGNDDHLVIVGTGRSAGDLAAAARVFWTLKVLGHDAVSVLDGGLIAYADAGAPLARGPERRPPTTFKATLRPALAPDAAAVEAARADATQLVDARSEGEFVGIYTGDSDERPGTIPGAKHLPYDWVAADGGATLRSAGALAQLFEARGIDPAGAQVHFCHSGNRAALSWFAAYAVLGNEQARLYDGSMMEWAQSEDRPVAAAIELCEAC